MSGSDGNINYIKFTIRNEIIIGGPNGIKLSLELLFLIKYITIDRIHDIRKNFNITSKLKNIIKLGANNTSPPPILPKQ